MKKFVKILSTLFVATLLVALLCGCNVPKSSLNANANDFTKGWMASIDDKTLVKQIAMPGSNDQDLVRQDALQRLNTLPAPSSLIWALDI